MSEPVERPRTDRPQPALPGVTVAHPVVGRLYDLTAAGTRRVARTVLRSWMDLDVAGLEHVPADGPVILAATHTSHADSLAVGAAVGRVCSFVGAADLASTPVLGPLLPRLGLIGIERGSGDVGAMAALAAVVADGAALVVYPEGSRSRDGRVHRPRSGVARLAAATGAPVVPVGITGTAAVWPVDTRPQLRADGAVRVRFGPPLAAPAAGPRARRAWNDQLHAELVRLAGRPRADHLAPVGGAA